MIFIKDKEILRKLGHLYFECSNSAENEKRKNLHITLNDLKPVRPILLSEEFPWHELNFDGSLTLECENEENRKLELHLRKKLMQWKHFAGDMILEPYIKVPKIISEDDIGVEVHDEKIKNDENNNIAAHKFINQFESIEDVEKLHNTKVTYFEKETLGNYNHFQEIFNGVIPVEIVGLSTGYSLGGCGNGTWDIISNYMGVNDLLFNMIDEPEFMHALVRRLTDIFMDKVRQFEELNLFNANAYECHCSSALSNDLKKNPIIDGKVTAKNVWGRGLAQILTSVSPEMHEEFDINYMIESLSQFGLVYYGCCEALDKKIDIVKKIPNLRKICISPWADVNVSAEQIRSDYVMCAKPNPAIVGETNFDAKQAEIELKTMIDAAQRYNCPLEILLKDISTVAYNPQNLIKWHELAMSMIN